MTLLYTLSDDLTGASAVASLIGESSVTVQFKKFNHFFDRYDFVSIDIGTRNTGSNYAKKKTLAALHKLSHSFVACRIDSTLRGNVAATLSAFSNFGKLLLTDTIPSYGRFTSSGITHLDGDFMDLKIVLNNMSKQVQERIEIVDAQDERDLKRIARRCILEGRIPADPGPLIAQYARLLRNKI